MTLCNSTTITKTAINLYPIIEQLSSLKVLLSNARLLPNSAFPLLVTTHKYVYRIN